MNSYGCGWNDHPRGCKPEEGAKINAAETEGGLLSSLPVKLSFKKESLIKESSNHATPD
jgi:hypothetical protein